MRKNAGYQIIFYKILHMKTLVSILVSIFLSSSLMAQNGVKWVDLSTAEALAAKYPRKKILMMFYTSWCDYCKKANGITLKDGQVIKYIAKNYIPVRIDAETGTTVTYRKKKYHYLKSFKVNGLAYSMLDGRPRYPSFLIIDKDGKVIDILKGYLPAPDFLRFLTLSHKVGMLHERSCKTFVNQYIVSYIWNRK
ncbi:MAG: thioredoxin family protein [Flavobacteriales bacterium Tduv]